MLLRTTNTKNKTLLLVEDDIIMAKMETQLLKSYGYEVIHVFSGEEAIQFMQDYSSSVDLILMDIDLGEGMDGTEAAKKILQNHNVPVLFLSSHTEKEIVEKTENVTSYGYVVKNSGITVLDASIKMAFKLFYAHQEITENFHKLKKLKEELELKEKELIKSEAKFHNAFHYSPAVLVISTLEDGKILEVNSSWTEILGYTHDESIGKTFIELGIATQEESEKFLQEITQSFVLKNREYSVKNKYGELKHFQYCCVVHELDGNKLLFSSAIDITNTKNIRAKILEHQEEFQQVFENTPNLFFKCTRNGIITRFLAGKRSNFYLSSEQFVGKHISNVLPEPIANLLIEGFNEAFKTKQSISVEYPLKNSDSISYFRASLTPIDSEKAFAVIYDITERKQSELEKEKLLRFYNFSRKINELLIREKTRESLFQNVCKIAVEYGSFLFAWIGIFKENRIVPSVFYGKEEGYLDFLKSISLQNPLDQIGPSATAFLKKEIVYCNDIETDPRMIKWREEALKRGYLSSVAIPFFTEKISGTLNLYSNKKNIFKSHELEILDELQNSLNFTLERILS